MPSKDNIRPLISNLNIFPDGTISKGNLPIFILEVFSGKLYGLSICKTVSNLIDQFRLLRMYNQGLEQMVSFTFPRKYGKKCVTKVTVRFNAEQFCFDVRMQPLEIDDILSEFTQAMEASMKCLQGKSTSWHYFFRLNDAEIKPVFKLQGSYKLTQVPTPNNMLFYAAEKNNSGYFYKYVVDEEERRRLVESSKMLLKCDHVVTHEIVDIVHFDLLPRQVFKLPCLIPNLSYEEIRCCLRDFMSLTANAIESIHQYGLAHLDVRVPNVCFKITGTQFIAVLIDIDRCALATSTKKPPYTGNLYNLPDGWTVDRLDWKQLGLLAMSVMCIDGEDQCVQKLISEGKHNYCRLLATLCTCTAVVNPSQAITRYSSLFIPQNIYFL